MKERTSARLQNSGEKLKVKSALNPMLWLCGIVSVPAIAAYKFLVPPPIWLDFVICAPVATAIIGFFYFMFFDSDKLQSEDFQLKKKTLEYMQQKGESLPSLADDTALITPPQAIDRLEDKSK